MISEDRFPNQIATARYQPWQDWTLAPPPPSGINTVPGVVSIIGPSTLGAPNSGAQYEMTQRFQGQARLPYGDIARAPVVRGG